MADGTHQAIKNIKLGDQIAATDPETGEHTTQTVTRLWAHPAHLYTLEIDNEPLITTNNHPLWNTTTHTWTNTNKLTTNHSTLAFDGTEPPITKPLNTGKAHVDTAYNLTTTGPHTYHITKHEILVHNCDPVAKTGADSYAVGPATEKVSTVLDRIDAVGSAPPGYKGGAVFRNDKKVLPIKPGITYREWDVNPKTAGISRGGERLVTGSDGSVYYTSDHYGTFSLLRGPTK
ncbi:MAG: hypothetical protein LBH13_03175 [Cellulomonadaceae bacterium]|nr:hypothetical protein [Cellulomonadaceae bacterium]